MFLMRLAGIIRCQHGLKVTQRASQVMVSSAWDMPKGEMARDAPTSDTPGSSAAPLEPCPALCRVT